MLPAELGSSRLEATLHLGKTATYATGRRAHEPCFEYDKSKTRRSSPRACHCRLSPTGITVCPYQSVARAVARAVRALRVVDRTGSNAVVSRPNPRRSDGGSSLLSTALHSRDSDGIGNFSDLDKLMRLTRDHGGAFVSTLPFLATFPNEPSPYSPVSRLFWNELFIDTGDTGSPLSLTDDAARLRSTRRISPPSAHADNEETLARSKRLNDVSPGPRLRTLSGRDDPLRRALETGGPSPTEVASSQRKTSTQMKCSIIFITS